MRIIATLMCGLLALPMSSAADDPKVAWIVANPEGGMVTIKAFAALENGETGSYELSATKKGTAGSSTNKQAGTVRAATAEDARPLSVSRISVEEGATLDVVLKVTSASGETYETMYVFTRN